MVAPAIGVTAAAAAEGGSVSAPAVGVAAPVAAAVGGPVATPAVGVTAAAGLQRAERTQHITAVVGAPHHSIPHGDGHHTTWQAGVLQVSMLASRHP